MDWLRLDQQCAAVCKKRGVTGAKEKFPNFPYEWIQLNCEVKMADLLWEVIIPSYPDNVKKGVHVIHSMRIPPTPLTQTFIIFHHNYTCSSRFHVLIQPRLRYKTSVSIYRTTDSWQSFSHFLSITIEILLCSASFHECWYRRRKQKQKCFF